jgi:hypothetical protein
MTTDLVQWHDRHTTTTSLIVAEKFGKRHKHVLQAIERLECSEGFQRLNFQPLMTHVEVGKGDRERLMDTHELTAHASDLPFHIPAGDRP